MSANLHQRAQTQHHVTKILVGLGVLLFLGFLQSITQKVVLRTVEEQTDTKTVNL
jgi:hypothetical protein